MPETCCQTLQNILHGRTDCFKDKSVAVREQGKRFEIQTSSSDNYCRVHIDGCLIQEQISKCDYLFFKCDTETFIFLELKGKHIESAYQQICSSITYLKTFINLEKHKIYAFIVSSGSPGEANQKFQKMQEQFIKNYGMSLLRYTNQAIISEKTLPQA